MSAECQSRLRTHDQIDKRVPPEILERIFNRLYPSRLTRVSIVNHIFNKVVFSLTVWPRMFSVTFGPTMRLCTLYNMPESKSYMLYMCASSLYVCQMCLAHSPRKGPNIAMPSPAPPPTILTKDNTTYLGEEVDVRWKVWLCNGCRLKSSCFREAGYNQKTRDRILWYRGRHCFINK